MGGCIWYVSKYVSPPGMGSAGGRGYLLMRELARAGDRVLTITPDSNQLAHVPDPASRTFCSQSMEASC